MIPWLETDTPFPDVNEALTEADGAPGLLAAGATLSPERLLDAYRQGIFPWFSEHQPVLWWSTDPRMVLPTAEFKVSESLRKTLRKVDQSMRTGGRWQVRFDSDFTSVIQACAAPRERSSGTWISDEIIAAYCRLHAMGYAHSSEVWRDGALVGGAYGICIGRMFYGESMFARVTDASKIALAYLVEFLRAHDVELIDCQQETDHLASLGGRLLARTAFISQMKIAIAEPAIEQWVPRLLYSETR
jgi:leucyl/phenylalanyl-tRNA--protein transferase